MNNSIKKILNKLEKNGFEAYVVGGYVRDYLLNITSYDVDICTNALPKDIIKVFKIKKGVSNYGSIGFKIGKYNYDITTYREDGEYNNHKPKSIKYVDNLLIDLKRRDFRINSICMNSEGKIFDYLNGKEDIHNKLIKTIGSTNVRLYEDPVRILRAIRFAIILDFNLDEEILNFIKNNKDLLKRISYTRKKQELDKIFSSINQEKGIKLLLELGIDKSLSLPKLKTIVPCRDIIGIWAQLEVDDIYPFTKNEKDQMNQIRNLLKQDIHNKYNIYKYGLYISTVVYQIKKEDISTLNKVYKELPIHSQSDLSVKPLDIASILQKEPDNYIKNITIDLEKQILLGNLENDYESIKKYILNYYAKESKKS